MSPRIDTGSEQEFEFIDGFHVGNGTQTELACLIDGRFRNRRSQSGWFTHVRNPVFSGQLVSTGSTLRGEP